VLALALFVLAPTASAQLSGAGLKGGVNFSNVDLTGEDIGGLSFDQRIGATGGYFVHWNLNNNFGLHVETLFSQKGTRFNNPFGTGQDLKIRVDYIEVPLMAHFDVPPADRVQVQVFGGAAIAGRLHDSQKLGGVKLTDDERIPIKNYDVGLTFGAALDVRRVIFDVRYTYGLKNINDGNDSDEFEVRTRTFTTMVGYRFW
jgi:hypothetical protein